MGWLKDLLGKGESVSEVWKNPALINLLEFGNKHDDDAGLPDLWKKNLKISFPEIKSFPSIYSMPMDFKALVFVGMSPVLNKSWEALKDLDKRIGIVATNSSCGFLIEKGIIPDYMVLLDGQKGAWNIDVGPIGKDIMGIFSPCAEPEAIKVWPGKKFFIPYNVSDPDISKEITDTWGKALPAGGNAFNSAVAIFVLLSGIKIYAFAGNELSFTDTYYADRPSQNDGLAYFFTKNIYGEEVRTFLPLFEYKVWLENMMAELHPDLYFVNCSEGILGVDLSGELYPFISHKPLDMAISEIIEALDFETLPWLEQNKIFYEEAYKTGLYYPRNSHGMWEQILEQIPDFNKALDVGCGTGVGIKLARGQDKNVHGVDISDNREIWEENGISEYCKQAPASCMPYKDGSFDLVVCSEVLEHIPKAGISDTFKEIYRVGSDKYLFTIGLVPEKQPIAGCIYSHITLEPITWWLNQIEAVGYNIAMTRTSIRDGETEPFGLMVFAVKDKNKYKKV